MESSLFSEKDKWQVFGCPLILTNMGQVGPNWGQNGTIFPGPIQKIGAKLINYSSHSFEEKS